MGSKTVEQIVEEVGSFGRFQYLLLLLSRACIPMATWSMLFMIFGAVEPDWWCESHDPHNTSELHFQNNSLSDVKSAGIEGNSNLTTSSGTWRGVYNLTNDSGLPFANSSRKNCGVSDGPNEKCENIVFAPGMNTLVSQFQLVCGLSWVPSMIISIQMFGVLIGACVSGLVADGIGRKKTIASITALHAVFNLIAAFSVSWEMFAVMRILIGLTIGGNLATAYGYPTEFIGKKRRAVVGAMPFWAVGSLTYSLLVWALPNWSYQHFAIAVGSAACLPVWLFLPESVHWLSVKGRMTEAHAVLVKIAKWNRRTPPTLQSMQELCVESDSTQKKYHYLHLFSSWKLVKMSALHGWLSFSNSLGYYALSFGIKNLYGDFYINFIVMSSSELGPFPLAYPLANFFGRRWTVFGCMFTIMLSTLAAVPISLLFSDEEGGTTITALCIAARSFLILGWSIENVYIAEQYPTVVRNIALGYANTIARLGGILSPYILSFGEQYMFFALISGVMLLSSIAPLLMNETLGRPLPDELPPPCWKRNADRIPGDRKEFELVKATEE